MKKNSKLKVTIGLAIISATLLATVPTAFATWYYHSATCSLTPGNGCGYAWGSVAQLNTYVDSTSSSTYICAGYVITSGGGSGACTVIYSSGSGSTFNNAGTQSADSLYLDCTSSTCGGYSGASTSLKYTDSAFIN